MNCLVGGEDQLRSDHGVSHARVSRQDLEEFLTVRGEGEDWDFKATLGDLTTTASRVSLAKDALAFANLPKGGTIVVGVEDDFTRVGLRDVEHLDTTDIRSAVERYIDGDFVVVAAEHVVAEEGKEPKRFGIVHFSRRSLQPVIAAQDGQFSIGKPEFRRGDILVRRGAASVRANTHDVRRLLTSSVISQERMDAARGLWAAVVELRELLGGAETLFDILKVDEYSNVRGNRQLLAYVTEETEFEVATKTSDIGRRVRLLRPLLPDQMYVTYWLYGAFVGRVLLKVVHQRGVGVFRSWTERQDGSRDEYLHGIASRLLGATELQAIWTESPFRPLSSTLDGIERDLCEAIRDVLSGLA